MAWTKDATSQSPKVIYVAPPEAHPMTAVIYDPNDSVAPWTIRYAHITGSNETVSDVEAAMGL